MARADGRLAAAKFMWCFCNWHDPLLLECGQQGTCEPVVAILVSPAAIACEVVALEVLKVGLLEPLLVACQRAQHAGPRLLDHKVSGQQSRFQYNVLTQ